MFYSPDLTLWSPGPKICWSVIVVVVVVVVVIVVVVVVVVVAVVVVVVVVVVAVIKTNSLTYKSNNYRLE